MTRGYNFSGGPSVLPLSVLEEIKGELLNYHQCGMSILEINHRSITYQTMFEETKTLFYEVLNIPSNYDVLLLHGGATLQFSMIPLNFLNHTKDCSIVDLKKASAEYIITGLFSDLAKIEAEKFGAIRSIYDDKEYKKIPDSTSLKFSKDASYVHYCDNNTIYGTQFTYIPDTLGIALICDMSSSILSKPVTIDKFTMIYGGVQKNIGIAGLGFVIVKKGAIPPELKDIPAMLSYHQHLQADSMYNTPPTFAVYVLSLMLKWIKKQGGLIEIEKCNQKKAKIIYDYLDSSVFYTGISDKSNRSLMNVTFKTPNENLDQLFIKEAQNQGLYSLKGHHKVGGLRASIYNAMPIKGVQKLVEFMKEFEKTQA